MNRFPHRMPGGYSLVELVIVMALTAVLMSLAVPAYRGYIERAHRTEAIARLVGVAGCQERLRIARGAYDSRLCLPDDDARYAFAYAPLGTSGFEVRARPVGAQRDDPCGTLILDHRGGRRITAERVDATRCWAGR